MATLSRRSICLLVHTLLCLQAGAVVVQVPNQQGSLNDYLCGTLSSTVVSGTTLVLNQDETHVISGESCMWQNLGNVEIRSSGETPATIHCDGSDDVATPTGFAFVEMNTFSLRNLRFENCGGTLTSQSSFPSDNTPPPIRNAIELNQQVVLIFSHCSDVTIEKVTINNYRGYAIYGINFLGLNRLQEVTVTDSYAYRTGMRSSSGKELNYSGSGMFFHFSNRPLVPPALQQPTNISILNSTLSNNFNIYPEFYIHSLQDTRLQNQLPDFPLHGGGGLTVHFEQQDRRVKMYIENTHFVNNSGTAGGGSQIITRNTIDNSDTVFNGCTFVNNGVYKYSSFFAGGGLEFFFIVFYSELSQLNRTAGTTRSIHRVENSEFRNNFGELGSAIAVFTEAQNIAKVQIDVVRVQFIDNEASIDGDCILVESENSATYSEIRPSLVLQSITVRHSSREFNNPLDSAAALSFNNIFVYIFGNTQEPTIISNGKNGGLKLFNTYAFLQGDVQFVNNSAKKGGAIAMEANSYLLFLEPANVLFSNNRAEIGGAIYSDIVRGLQCVVQFVTLDATQSVALNRTQLEELNFTITFIDNIALRDGNDIYALPVYYCSWFSESVTQVPTDRVTDVYETLYHFESNQTSVSYQEQIRSHPVLPCFCQQKNTTTAMPQCNPDFASVISISVPPGRSFDIYIVPADGMWHPVRSLIEAQLQEESGESIIRFLSNDRTRLIHDLNGTSCYPLKVALRNAENTVVSVKVSVQNVVGLFIEANVTLEKCPFGFKLNATSGICDCVPLFTNNNVQCDIEKGQFVKPSGYWIGRTMFEVGVPACVVRCPTGYCQARTTVDLSFDNQCNGSRTGEMCGQCKSNFSMQFGSTDCTKCSDFWLFTIVLYILAGILLVVTLFLLKLTITEGLLGSILFYAQLFSINLGLLVYSNETRFTTVFISLLNLELGFPLCFYNGMDQAAKHGLQFVFPVYLWLIVAVLTILSRYSSRLANLVGPEIAKVFVTLIYFAYTKLQRTSTEVLIYAHIVTNTNNSYLVWFSDGGEKYFKGHHLVLGLVAIFFLIFILTPYTFFMFFSQWCLRFSWISRHFKPLIDANLAPFKDRLRFWFGLRLLTINLLILLSIIITPLNFTAVIYAHLVVIVMLLVFQAQTKPYKSKLLHYLDLFFLINYVFYLIGCLFIYDVIKPSPEDQKIYVTAVEVGIIGSAFVVFVVTIVCHVVIRVRKFFGLKKKGEMKPNQQPEEEVGGGTEMESNTDSIVNTIRSNSNELYALRPQNVTLTVVDISRDRVRAASDFDDGGGRLRESLLADY